MKLLILMTSLFLFANVAQAKDTEKPKEKQKSKYEAISSIDMGVEDGFSESSEINKPKEKKSEKDT